MRGKHSAFRPLQSRGRRTVGAIILAFGLFSGLSLFLSIRTTTHAAHQAPMLEIAARQRTLAEAYTKDVLLRRAGVQADPATIASLLQQSASTLLLGGVAPAEDGDDDQARMPAATGTLLKRQISQEGRLVHDLAATGVALLAGKRGPMRLDRARASAAEADADPTPDRAHRPHVECLAERRPHDGPSGRRAREPSDPTADLLGNPRSARLRDC